MTVWLLFPISYFLLWSDLLLQSPALQILRAESHGVAAPGSGRGTAGGRVPERAAEDRSLRSASVRTCVTHTTRNGKAPICSAGTLSLV